MKFFNIALLAVAAQAVSLNQMTTGPMDTTTPPMPMDTTTPPMDASMPPMDTTMPPMPPMDGSMGPDGSMPPMDTHMPPMDGMHGPGPNDHHHHDDGSHCDGHHDDHHHDDHHQEGPSKEEVMAMMKKHDKNGDGKVGINEADKGLKELGMGDEERAAFIEDKFQGDNAGKNYEHEDVMAAMDAETDPTDAANQAQ